MTIGVDTKGSEKDGVGSRAIEGKRADDSCGSNKRYNSCGGRETTLNSLITGVVSREIVLSGLGALFNGNSINDGNLKLGWTVGNNMSITLTVVILDYRTKCGEVHVSTPNREGRVLAPRRKTRIQSMLDVTFTFLLLNAKFAF